MTSSSTSGDDSSSSYSNYSSDDSDSFSESSLSDDSPFSDNSSPDRHCHQQNGRRHVKWKKHPTDKHCHQKYDRHHLQQDKLLLENHRQDPVSRYRHRQRRFPLSENAERIFTDEQRFSQYIVPRNQDLGSKATTKTVKVERDPSISDIIEQHLIFHQRCDNIEHMLRQLLERSQKHPLTNQDDSQSLNGKGLYL